MFALRATLLAIVGTAMLSCVDLWATQSESALRRITNTTDAGININPSISGDGRIIAFESTEDVAGAGGTNHFRAIRANISVNPATFFQMGRTRTGAPGLSQDGSRIVFASKEDPLGTNADGNSEIFVFNGSNLVQLTHTTPGSPGNRVTEGNFQPSISDDGRFIAFSSNRNLTSQNGDGNLEVFFFDSVAAAFMQLTNSTGIVGFSDVKISGDGSTVACIRDTGATASANRDLLRINRSNASETVLSLNVARLAMTYGRAISDDGTRVVYSAETAPNSTQVFFYDGRSGHVNRQMTTLGARTTEVPLHPTISGDGQRIAFATRRAVTGFSNADASVELYTYDIPTRVLARITNATSGDADCFDASNAACEVVSSLNDDGSTVVFNFPRALSGIVTAGLGNKPEIYATGLVARPPFGALTSILNQASLGHEPSPIKAVSPNSIAAAFGSALANTTQQPQKQADGTFPTNVGGTTVTVNGRAAQIFFVSPERVHFLLPSQTEIGNAEVVITNADGFASKGTAPVLLAAPGIFTKTGDGIGEGMILNAGTLAEGPFDPSAGNLRLLIFSTGVRNGVSRTVNIGGRVITPDAVNESTEMPGLDEVLVRVPADLRGAGNVNLFITADGRDSNPVTVKFLGDPSRNVMINEVLADPPDGIAGDANHDGLRDGTDDEFIELVNGTSSEVISLGGWTIRTRATGSSTENTRFTFASGASLPPGEAIVVFGGGDFNPSDTIFGCAHVVKATTTAGLSLTNSGVTILIRDASGNLISEFSYGGSTGRDGDNNQSFTRSPDITGAYVQHTAASGANGRGFSPGLRTDGTPFGNCGSIPTAVNISPSAAITIGQAQQFTAQAFDQFGRAMTGVRITFSSDNTNVATVESVTVNSTTGVATANVQGRNPGTAHITASATDGVNTVNSTQATLSVAGPSLSINDVYQNEGNSGGNTFTFTVSLSTPVPSAVTFDITTQDDTATSAAGDYVARSLTSQTIAAGQATYTFDVTVTGDTLVEPNETFFVNITNVSNATIGDGAGQGTIQNDDTAALVISQVYAGGNNSGAPFQNDFVEIFNRGTTTVDFSLTPYSVQYASVGSSFGSAKTNLISGSIAPGKYFLVQESGGTTNGVPLPTPDAIGTIPMAAPSGKVALVAGTTTLSASTCPGDGLLAPFNPDDATIADFVGYGSTAGNAGHCHEGSAPAAAPNNTTAGLRKGGGCVDTNDNGADFFVRAPVPRNSSTPPNTCSGQTADIVINDVTVTESDSGTVSANFTVSLISASSSTITVDYSTANGTAVEPDDYTAVTTTELIFNPGETLKPVSVLVNGDTLDEPNETFFVNLSNATNAAILDPHGQGTITDNDVAPDLTINDISQNETNAGTTTFMFTVHLSAPALTGGVTFDIATADGTAQDGDPVTEDNDYVPQSLTARTIPAGTQDYLFSVTVNGDTHNEPNETFFVNVTNVSGANVLDGQGQGTIQNDDSPTLSITDVTQAEGNNGTSTFTFSVMSSLPAPAGGISFMVNTAEGTTNPATAGGDYIAIVNGSGSISKGNTSTTVAVTVNGDTLVESSETFLVNLTNATNATIGDGQGLGTITNDDNANLVIAQVYGGGGNAGATYTHDFIEIFNRGTSTVNFAITPYSVQYAAATSNFTSNKTNITSGTIAPGQYFLIRAASGGVNGVALPPADATGSIAMSATAGKVALVLGTNALTGSGCPFGATIVDFLGYGTAANCSETAPIAMSGANSNARSAIRTVSCADTNNNAADFSNPITAPTARNLATTPTPCP